MLSDFSSRMKGFLGHSPGGDEVVLPAQPPRAAEPGRLPVAGPLRFGKVEVGLGRPVVHRLQQDSPPATLWVTDAAVPDAATAWCALVEQFPATGLWPLLLHSLYDGSGRPWDNGELEPVPEAGIDALDPRQVLESGWYGWLVPVGNPWPPGTGPLAPFGPEFPGLAPSQPPSEEVPVAFTDGSAHLGLVSCRRPADAVAVAGWLGAINVTGAAQVSAVLRSWEDRFGAMVAGLGFATITLLVSRPPTSDDDALRVAAEVAALCPDALWQPESLPPYETREATLEAVSRHLVREPVWRLWFD
ncbi:MAG: DUF4253 domain-containing protein [Actinomycetes bacterium]